MKWWNSWAPARLHHLSRVVSHLVHGAIPLVPTGDVDTRTTPVTREAHGPAGHPYVCRYISLYVCVYACMHVCMLVWRIYLISFYFRPLSKQRIVEILYTGRQCTEKDCQFRAANMKGLREHLTKIRYQIHEVLEKMFVKATPGPSNAGTLYLWKMFFATVGMRNVAARRQNFYCVLLYTQRYKRGRS